MTLFDIVRRSANPLPWSEGDNIPWHDPDFGQRMLQEHLSQDHDAASRRFVKIDQHVRWIHQELLSGRPTRILDLACGPGLYTTRLARLGHECVGIDYSPASIAHARDLAAEENLDCRYVLQDIRTAEYGTGYGLAMLIFGEFNVFRPTDAWTILRKAEHALTAGGLLLLEPHNFATIQRVGEQIPSWYSSEGGLFSDRPHLYLQESFWDATRAAATIRYFVIDAATGHLDRYAQSLQAYTDQQYEAMLVQCGFDPVRFYASLGDPEDQATGDFFAIVGQKR